MSQFLFLIATHCSVIASIAVCNALTLRDKVFSFTHWESKRLELHHPACLFAEQLKASCFNGIRMTSSAASKAERIVGSFASLMSSALVIDGGAGLEDLKDSSAVLPRFISPSVATDQECLGVPSLLLKHASISSSKGSSLEESAALNLARTMKLSPNEISSAPVTLLANLCDSFTALIDSRLRSSIQAFVKQSHQQKDSTLTRVLVGLLACSQSPITPSTVVTSFRTLRSCEITPNGEVIMPLVLECVIDLKIFGNLVTINFVAPGTIHTALSNNFMIFNAEIVLDTLALLQSMMKQARFAVRKAVAIASDIATNLLLPSSLPETNVLSGETKSLPNRVPSSHDLKHQLGAQETTSLMPPPPSRPSKQSLSDLSNVKAFTPSVGQQNSSWDESPSAGKRATASGLSLLTTAASLNTDGKCSADQWPAAKRQKTEDMNSQRKASSCPQLEASR